MMFIRLLIACKIGMAEIFGNKLRSGLSVFAVAIGISTFLFVFSVVKYSKDDMEETVKLGGQNTIFITVKNSRKIRLDMKDYPELVKKFPEVKSISPVSWPITFHTAADLREYQSVLFGITPEWRKTNWVYGAVKGRFISWDDVLQRRKVAVFIREPLSNKDKVRYAWNGWRMGNVHSLERLKWLLSGKFMLDKKVNIQGSEFTIIGEVRAPYFGDDKRVLPDGQDNAWDFIVPVTSLMDLAPFARYFISITMELYSEKDIDAVKQRLMFFFKERFGTTIEGQDYEVKTLKEVAEKRFEDMRRNILLITVLGIIAMISGGIGIMNVVLATIFARTKEIGTRRALGASKLDIFMQFSIESIILSLFGALAGLAIAFYMLDYLGRMLEMPAVMGVKPILYSFLIAAGTGFLFSLYPSIKAANMNPVDALKVE